MSIISKLQDLLDCVEQFRRFKTTMMYHIYRILENGEEKEEVQSK